MQELKDLLYRTSAEKLKGLADILEASDSTVNAIADKFCCQSQNLGEFFWGVFSGKQPSYKEIVQQTARQLGISYRNYETSSEIEVKIAQHVMETVWENMTPEQRQQMDAELKATAAKYDKGAELLSNVSIFGALTAAKLSGFGVYLLASTTLGAITGVIGITLPFVIYTSMSTMLAVVIGPVGWLGAGLFAFWNMTGPNYKKLVPAILYVCMLRAELNGGFA